MAKYHNPHRCKYGLDKHNATWWAKNKIKIVQNVDKIQETWSSYINSEVTDCWDLDKCETG